MTSSSPHVLGLYLGEPSTVQKGKKAVKTGVHKLAVPAAWLDVNGVQGDHVLDRRYHGGPDQAVYLYTQPDAEAWAERGMPTDPTRAYWSENVRVSGLASAELRVGDRLQLGEALLEVTAPRLPCAIAAVYAADVYAGPFVKDFYAVGCPGIYARVLRPAQVQVGDPVSLEHTAHGSFPTLGELMAAHKDGADAEFWQRALLAPLSHRLREEAGAKLAKQRARGF